MTTSRKRAMLELLRARRSTTHRTGHPLVLGGCRIQIGKRSHSLDTTAEDHVRRILDIPAHVRVESIASTGYPAETKTVVPLGRLDVGKIRLHGY